ncbi:hypothetical protein Hypma_010508 [Hypsizygus marmoreus]|uniref:Uncharacterized protein n=1 Tax=Hypsizygus marmoreus TaxID=39966 RepID=A0A369JUD2_HYPMA|nr:hypothetical protein Hypma_010508 [Hypsizygus marmoreus]
MSLQITEYHPVVAALHNHTPEIYPATSLIDRVNALERTVYGEPRPVRQTETNISGPAREECGEQRVVDNVRGNSSVTYNGAGERPHGVRQSLRRFVRAVIAGRWIMASRQGPGEGGVDTAPSNPRSKQVSYEGENNGESSTRIMSKKVYFNYL